MKFEFFPGKYLNEKCLGVSGGIKCVFLTRNAWECMVKRQQKAFSAVSETYYCLLMGRFIVGSSQLTSTYKNSTSPHDGWKRRRQPYHCDCDPGGGRHSPTRIELALALEYI